MRGFPRRKLPRRPTPSSAILEWKMPSQQQIKNEALSAPPAPKPPRVLIDLAIFEGKPKISRVAEIEWVYNCLDAQVSIEDAPSAGAWTLLQHVRSGPFERQKFYDQFATKLIPPKNKLDQDGRHEDDGREQLKILDAVERELLKGGEVCSTCHGSGRC